MVFTVYAARCDVSDALPTQRFERGQILRHVLSACGSIDFTEIA
jgi:hypothetical protein